MCGSVQIGHLVPEIVRKHIHIDEGVEWVTGDVSAKDGRYPLGTIIRRKHDLIIAENMVWGIPISWNATVYNARMETVKEKPLFAGAYQARQTCLFPVSNFFEDGESFGSEDGIVYLAGIYFKGQEPFENFVVLTTPAICPVLFTHNRAPLAIKPSQLLEFLDFQHGKTVIHPASFSKMELLKK